MTTQLSQNFGDKAPVSASLSGLRPSEVKAPTAFRTISEVATNLAVPQHVLRFWESKFQQIRPLKRGGGRRYYRPEDVVLLNNIKELLYTQGMTIKGVQKLLREGGRPQFARPPSATTTQVAATASPSVSAPAATQSTQGLSTENRREVESILSELRTLRMLLRQSGI